MIMRTIMFDKGIIDNTSASVVQLETIPIWQQPQGVRIDNTSVSVVQLGMIRITTIIIQIRTISMLPTTATTTTTIATATATAIVGCFWKGIR